MMIYQNRRVLNPAAKRSGFTLIELLVSLGVIAVLVALASSAALNAREASRSIACRANLRQVQLAHENYFSQYRRGVPYLHHAIAVSAFLERAELRDVGPDAPVGKVGYEIWACPSDPQLSLAEGNYSYLPSLGVGLGPTRTGAARQVVTGAIRGLGRSSDASFLSPAEYTRGLSSTITLGERLIDPVPLGEADPSYADDRLGSWFTRELSVPERRRVGVLNRACSETSDRGRFAQDYAYRAGMRVYQVSSNGVLAISAPNGRTCYPGPQPPRNGGPGRLTRFTSTAATSYHRASINAAFADGHVEPVSETIDLGVWRALNNAAAFAPESEARR